MKTMLVFASTRPITAFQLCSCGSEDTIRRPTLRRVSMMMTRTSAVASPANRASRLATTHAAICAGQTMRPFIEAGHGRLRQAKSSGGAFPAFVLGFEEFEQPGLAPG